MNKCLFRPFQGPVTDPKLIRIGDFMAYMIMAKYKKEIENKKILFSLIEKNHKLLKADILFKELFDKVYYDEIPFKDADEIYDPENDGGFWHIVPEYLKIHGSRILPDINLEKKYYKGPELDWGEFIVLNPLFSAEYNIKRNMDPNFINDLILELYKKFGNKLIVITDKIDYITDKFNQVLVSDDLYSLMYIIGKAKVFIGGDTGFTHFAGLARVPNIIALYGTKYPRIFEDKSFNANPNIDEKTTKLSMFYLKDHKIKKKKIKEICNIIEESFNEYS